MASQRGRIGADASVQTRRPRRVGADASEWTRRRRRVGPDVSEQTRRCRRVGAWTRRRGRVGTDASVQTRRRVDVSGQGADTSEHRLAGASCVRADAFGNLSKMGSAFSYINFPFQMGRKCIFLVAHGGDPCGGCFSQKNVRAYFLLAAPSSRGAPIPAASRARFNSLGLVRRCWKTL